MKPIVTLGRKISIWVSRPRHWSVFWAFWFWAGTYPFPGEGCFGKFLPIRITILWQVHQGKASPCVDEPVSSSMHPWMSSIVLVSRHVSTSGIVGLGGPRGGQGGWAARSGVAPSAAATWCGSSPFRACCSPGWVGPGPGHQQVHRRAAGMWLAALPHLYRWGVHKCQTDVHFEEKGA